MKTTTPFCLVATDPNGCNSVLICNTQKEAENALKAAFLNEVRFQTEENEATPDHGISDDGKYAFVELGEGKVEYRVISARYKEESK